MVKIMIGKDSGKTGKVAQVLPGDGNSNDKVVVEGLNILKKNIKPQKRGEKGQILEFSAPVQASNVQIVCSKCNKVTRVGFKLLADGLPAGKAGKKQRTCRKCNEVL